MLEETELQDDAEQIEEPGEGGAEGGEPEVEAKAEKAEAAVVDPAEFKRVQRELKDTRRLAREHEKTAQFWAERAQATGQPSEPTDKDQVDELEDVDLVSEITTNGVKGLKKIMDRFGYVSAKDVDRRIAATRNEITEQAQLIGQYPDLNDPSSTFFKTTAKIYSSLKDDMSASKAIAVAARLAKAELGNPRRRQADPDADEGDDQGDEGGEVDERAQRIARQSGDRGRRESQRQAPATLNREQKQMVADFKRAGADITEESYMKAALKGVNVGGIPQRESRRA